MSLGSKVIYKSTPVIVSSTIVALSEARGESLRQSSECRAAERRARQLEDQLEAEAARRAADEDREQAARAELQAKQQELDRARQEARKNEQNTAET